MTFTIYTYGNEYFFIHDLSNTQSYSVFSEDILYIKI